MLSRNWSVCIRRSVAMALMVDVTGLAGCRDRSGELETAPVSGTVTLDGKPLTTGTVIFSPEAGRVARGSIGEDGSYRLTTYRSGDGAIVGKHKVAVMAAAKAMKVGNVEGAVPLTPMRYASPESSGLTFEVKSGEGNEFPIALKSR